MTNPYKDDLESAHCRISALEGEKKGLESKLDKIEKERKPGKFDTAFVVIVLLLIGFGCGVAAMVIKDEIDDKKAAKVERMIKESELRDKRNECRMSKCREICDSPEVWDYHILGTMRWSTVKYENEIPTKCICRSRNYRKEPNIFPGDMKDCERLGR